MPRLCSSADSACFRFASLRTRLKALAFWIEMSWDRSRVIGWAMCDFSLISKGIVMCVRELRLLFFCAAAGHSQGVQIIGLELADVLPVESWRGDQQGHGVLEAHFLALAHFKRIGV